MLWENGRELRINLIRIDDITIKSEPLSPSSIITATARKRTSRISIATTARKKTWNKKTGHQGNIPIFVPRPRQPSSTKVLNHTSKRLLKNVLNLLFMKVLLLTIK